MRSSLLIAIAVAVIAVIWVVSGVVGGGEKPEAEQPSQHANTQAEISEVRVVDMISEPMVDHVSLTGRSQASRKVDLKAETEGQVVELLVEKGKTVKEGTALAKLELRDRPARVEEAEQRVNQKQIQYTAAKELADKGFSSKVRLAEAGAELEAARAQLKETRIDLSKTTIKAPFDGVINDQYIEKGDYVSTADMVFSIVDLDPLEIVGFVTEKNIPDISVGDQATAVLLAGETVAGEITFISPVANEQTRTFKIEISVPNPDYKITEGLTAKITIPVAEKQAYKISPSILSLSDDGTIGIKIVDEDNVVRFMPVIMIKDTPEYIWVGGLPETARVITVGQEFVVPGQTVKPVIGEDKSAQ